MIAAEMPKMADIQRHDFNYDEINEWKHAELTGKLLSVIHYDDGLVLLIWKSNGEKTNEKTHLNSFGSHFNCDSYDRIPNASSRSGDQHRHSHPPTGRGER